MSWVDRFLLQIGIISKNEYELRNIPKIERDETVALAKDLLNLGTYSNPLDVFQKKERLGKLIEGLTSKSGFSVVSATDLFGYRPATARLWNYFPNPFGVFSYIADNHWAAKVSLDQIRTEIEQDGFYLEYLEGIPPERVKSVKEIVDLYDLDVLRVDIALHLKIYGNAWIRPVKSTLNTIIRYDLLMPDLMSPIFENSTTRKIIGWNYEIGNGKSIRFELSDVRTIKLPSYSTGQIGMPPLASAVILIEADMYADMLNNTIFQKGGLLHALIALGSNDKDQGLNSPGVDEEYVERVQSKIDALFSGVRAGQGLAAISNVTGVYKLTDIGGLEANYGNSKDKCAKIVARLLGLSANRLDVVKSNNQQYEAAKLQDQENSAFNKMAKSLMGRVDRFINEEILQADFGYGDVGLKASGRYSGFTRGAAETIQILSKSGPVITKNEARERILLWEAVPPNDPSGNEYLNTSEVDRDPESLPPREAVLSPDKEPLPQDGEVGDEEESQE